MECTLKDLRYKEVISVTDGTRFGYVGDLEVDVDSGQIRSLIIPGPARFFGLFGHQEDVVIAWDEVRRFGQDIILVDKTGQKNRSEREKLRLW